MRGGALAQLPVFLAVAEHRSFTAAARALGISPSAASQSVARLEEELDVALLVRTTRSVSLTDAGTRLVVEAGPAVAAASTALLAVRRARDEPAGTLRLNVPRVACRVGLPPVLMEYARRYPQVRAEVVVDNRRVDVVREGFDAGIRVEESIDKDMVRVRLTSPMRLVVVGSKRYFAARGRPKHPRELVRHACLGWRSFARAGEHRWAFHDRGRDLEVGVSGPIFSNDAELLIACAERDVGLAFVAQPEVARQLASGKLETALDDYAVDIAGLFLYFSRAARHVPRLRAFVACARELTAGKKAR